MNLVTARTIIGNDEISDEMLSTLLLRAKKLAVNHYFWAKDDTPTDDEIDEFCDRYEFEIYDIAKAVFESGERHGLKSHTELGVKLEWGLTGKQSIDEVLSNIMPKTYVGV